MFDPQEFVVRRGIGPRPQATTPCINTYMRAFEFTHPKTPEQQRIASLKSAKDRAAQALKMERDRQKRAKAQKTIQSLNVPKPPSA